VPPESATCRFCSRSATPPATGATSWSASRSRTRRPPRLMNERFVCIKVDREERPDLDSIYMDAVVALSGHGGWPMTMFLTPDGEPFHGGTYFPPLPRHGLPSFREVLSAVSEAWHARREDVARSAGQLAEHVRSAARLQPSAEPLSEALLAEAQQNCVGGFRLDLGRLGRRAEVSARPVARVPAAPRRDGAHAADTRRDGSRRHVRPRRRRLPPILGRRAVARPAFREDALRQRAAGSGLCARLPGARRPALRQGGERDRRLRAARAGPRGRWLRIGAGRRYRRGRGPDLLVGAGRGGARRVAPAFRTRSLRAARRARPPPCRRSSSRSASSARGPCETTRRSRRGTA